MDLSSNHILGNSFQPTNTFCPASYLYFAPKFIIRNETSTALFRKQHIFQSLNLGKYTAFTLNLNMLKKSKQSQKVTLASRNI